MSSQTRVLKLLIVCANSIYRPLMDLWDWMIVNSVHCIHLLPSDCTIIDCLLALLQKSIIDCLLCWKSILDYLLALLEINH